ncbi:mixed lineage kinase domain-like protein [Neosynchiropus ocellatus]
MDKIGYIIKISCKIYEVVQTVKTNKKRCLRLGQRVNALKELVEYISGEASGSVPPKVEKALNELVETLYSTLAFIETYSDSSYILRVMKFKGHQDEFVVLNDQLTESFQILSLGLQAEQRERMNELFSLAKRQHEDEVDRKHDYKELKRDINKLLEDARIAKEMLEVPAVTRESIQFIKPKELTYEEPTKPFKSSKTSEFYKGKFNEDPVAIKRYLRAVTSARSVLEAKESFKREVETMKRFESPHILRVFGISIDQKDNGIPVYSIVMEYCEMGSLREVLDREELVLILMNKAQMCLDAAHGLYRLHQTGVKPRVHGCLTSSSFMVAKGLIVKLSDFELSQTESSFLMNPQPVGKRSIGHCAPEHFTSANIPYKSDIYSFGVVLWEIITRKTPWKDMSKEDVQKNVCDKQEREEITVDCPQDLRAITNDCRAFESSERPTAGVVLDRLRKVVMVLEKRRFSTAPPVCQCEKC